MFLRTDLWFFCQI